MGITFSQVNFNYNEKSTLNDINIKIPTGKFNVILGPSGSGKSTLLKLINGLLRPTAGSVIVNQHINHCKTKKKETKLLLNEVGFVFQNPEDQFFAETVLEELYYGPNNKGIPKEITIRNIEYLFNLFNLNLKYLKRSPRRLSGGEMRKIAIISSLLMEQNIILFDEPTAGLDIKSKYNIFQYLKEINQKKDTTIIVTTHEIDLAFIMADYIYLMMDGQIIDYGNPSEVFVNRNQKLELADFLRTPSIELINEFEKQFNVKLPCFTDVHSFISIFQKG